MVVKVIKAAELIEYIGSEEFKSSPVLPISSSRAISHFHNPRVSPDDPVLYVAYIDSRIVGYRLVLADYIFHASQKEKIGWFSCVWVDPAMRGKGIAKALVQRAMKDWDEKIILVDPAKESRALYMDTGKFSDGFDLDGVKAFRKFNLSVVLPPKSAFFRKLYPVLWILDMVLNIFLIPYTLKWKSVISKYKLHLKPFQQFDAGTKRFLDYHSTELITARRSEDFEWIHQYPWITEGMENEESRRYYFSSVADRFTVLFYKLTNNTGDIEALIFVTIRNDHMKVSYVFYNKGKESEVLKAINKVAVDYKVAAVTVFDKGIINEMHNKSTPFIYLKPVKKHFLISYKIKSVFAGQLTGFLQGGDGDSIFV
ncbi:MAG: GNAT family N-acetyltransferase [Cytophagaceae bacterium]